MPALIMVGIAAIGIGAGFKNAGEGINKAGNGSIKLAAAVSVAAGFYLYLRKG